MKPNLKVIILKRLPRYDRSSQDILGIKAKLSLFANATYDRLWEKLGNPENIQIVELQLNVEHSSHLRGLIFGSRTSYAFDGIHARGEGGSRHITYRSVQAVKPVLSKLFGSCQSQKPRDVKKGAQATNYDTNHSDHTNCETVRYQNKRYGLSYAQAVRAKQSQVYTVPTYNRFSSLN